MKNNCSVKDMSNVIKRGHNLMHLQIAKDLKDWAYSSGSRVLACMKLACMKLEFNPQFMCTNTHTHTAHAHTHTKTKQKLRDFQMNHS